MADPLGDPHLPIARRHTASAERLRVEHDRVERAAKVMRDDAEDLVACSQGALEGVVQACVVDGETVTLVIQPLQAS